VSNSVHASNLKRPETPDDCTDPHLIAALTASLRRGGPNTFAAGPVTTTATATGEARQRRDRRAAARTTNTAPAVPCHTTEPATPAHTSARDGRQVLYPPARKTRTPQVRPAPFRPGMFPRATSD
jgi:hypothetical protein